MKELKFRVWDKRDNMMHTPEGEEISYRGDLYLDPTGNLSEELDRDMCSINVTTFYVLRCTGFTDKLCNEIYEGDILEVAGGSKIVVNDLAEFLIYCGKYEEKNGVELFPAVQVVGNIYENGEMI